MNIMSAARTDPAPSRSLGAAFLEQAEALRTAGRADAAADLARAMLRGHPDLPEAHNALGLAQHDLNLLAEAGNHFRGAVHLAPHYAAAWINLGLVRQKQGALAEAEACYRAALARGATLRTVGGNLGLLLLERGCPDDAEAVCRAALDGPAGVAAEVNLAMALLLNGRLRDGWAAYEARCRVDGLVLPAPDLPGITAARGRRVLVQAEQGFGDVLQFCRYVPMLAAAGADVVLRVPRQLQRLLATLPAAVVAAEDDLPPVDYACRLMSLPHLFDTTLDTIPATIPYLSVADSAVATWRVRLDHLPGRRIGVVWAGGVRPDDAHACAIDRRRSVPLLALAPLAAVPGCSLVSLQVGPPAAQQRSAGAPPLFDPTADLHDFADTAALVMALDLVIAVDTAVAHLAAALGRPVWLLNRFDACWRWLRDRDDSPWYPTLRLYRQPAPGDWAAPIARVAADLTAFA